MPFVEVFDGRRELNDPVLVVEDCQVQEQEEGLERQWRNDRCRACAATHPGIRPVGKVGDVSRKQQKARHELRCRVLFTLLHVAIALVLGPGESFCWSVPQFLGDAMDAQESMVSDVQDEQNRSRAKRMPSEAFRASTKATAMSSPTVAANGRGLPRAQLFAPLHRAAQRSDTPAHPRRTSCAPIESTCCAASADDETQPRTARKRWRQRVSSGGTPRSDLSPTLPPGSLHDATALATCQ